MVKVLVVEDEASIREMIALNLRLAGMEAVEADSAEAALPLLEQRPGCDLSLIHIWFRCSVSTRAARETASCALIVPSVQTSMVSLS